MTRAGSDEWGMPRQYFSLAAGGAATPSSGMDTTRDGVSPSNGGTGILRVVVGEDNYLTGEGIARVIEHAPGLELVATRGDLQSLLAVIAEERPDVVLTDIRMPPTK